MSEDKKEKKSVRELLAEQFVAAIKADPIKWVQGFTSVRNVPCNGTNGRAYKNINRMILTWHMADKGYTDPRFYSQSYVFSSPENRARSWDDPEKIKVKKGEKAVLIDSNFYVPKSESYIEKLKISDAVKAEASQGLKPISMAQYFKLDAEHKALYRIVTKPIAVFNAEQLDGIKPMKEIKLNEDLVRDGRAELAVDNAIRNMEVGYEESLDVTTPCYRPMEDKIYMPKFEQFKNEYEYYGTKLHEIGHATGNSKRLARDMSTSFGSESYAIEELRAEIASCFIANDFGIPMPESALENHKAYVQSWAEAVGKDEKVLISAIFDAQAIADYVIEKTEIELDRSIEKETEEKDNSMEKEDIVIMKKEFMELDSIPEDREYIPPLAEWENVIQEKPNMENGTLYMDSSYAFRNYVIFREMEGDDLPYPVGRIDYLSPKGGIAETMEYTDAEQFKNEIKECSHDGVPMSVIIYRNEDGSTISYDFLSECFPITSVSVEDYSRSDISGGWNAAYLGKDGNDNVTIADKCLSKQEALEKVMDYEEKNKNLVSERPAFQDRGDSYRSMNEGTINMDRSMKKGRDM